MSTDRDAAHLWDLLDAARRMRELVAGGTLESVMADQRTRLALERLFEIMGEAARRVSEPGKVRYAEINWRGIIGLRNAIAHQYGDIDYSRLWAAATIALPGLIASLERLLDETRSAR
jgi:uncharacterized protein with HEPN domain